MTVEISERGGVPSDLPAADDLRKQLRWRGAAATGVILLAFVGFAMSTPAEAAGPRRSGGGSHDLRPREHYLEHSLRVPILDYRTQGIALLLRQPAASAKVRDPKPTPQNRSQPDDPKGTKISDGTTVDQTPSDHHDRNGHGHGHLHHDRDCTEQAAEQPACIGEVVATLLRTARIGGGGGDWPEHGPGGEPNAAAAATNPAARTLTLVRS